MDKRNLKWITWSFVALTVLIIVLILKDTLYRQDHIVLPDTSGVQDPTISETLESGNALTVIEITPETVQTAISSMKRMESYCRTVHVYQYWSGGSGSYELFTMVQGDWTRTDRTMPDGRVRHSLIGNDQVYIWYNNETTIYHGAAGEISADNEQTIPTYEDVLELPPESILQAEYGVLSGVNCIFVEAEDGSYTLRYWISVDSGLLVSAEKALDDETIYRMESLTVEQTELLGSEFVLPDGTVLTSGGTVQAQE